MNKMLVWPTGVPSYREPSGEAGGTCPRVILKCKVIGMFIHQTLIIHALECA